MIWIYWVVGRKNAPVGGGAAKGRSGAERSEAQDASGSEPPQHTTAPREERLSASVLRHREAANDAPEALKYKYARKSNNGFGIIFVT